MFLCVVINFVPIIVAKARGDDPKKASTLAGGDTCCKIILTMQLLTEPPDRLLELMEETISKCTDRYLIHKQTSCEVKTVQAVSITTGLKLN